MKRSRAATMFVLLLIAALAACRDREEPKSDVDQVSNVEPAAGERAPVPSDPVIEVQMGTGVTANGTVPEKARTDDFRAGDTIFITARLRGLEGQPVTVSWFGPGDLSAGTETAAVKPDGTIYFTKADTSSWIPGDYRVTLSAGPRTLISEQFHILGSEAAVMPHQ